MGVGETDRSQILVRVLVEELSHVDVLSSIHQHTDRLIGKQPIKPKYHRLTARIRIRVLELDFHRYVPLQDQMIYIIATTVE
jgi:hypothetical protein